MRSPCSPLPCSTTAPRRAAGLAALYHERWEIETAQDEVKTHILGPGSAPRSKSPDLVCRENDGLMVAHCAVRRLIHEDANKAGKHPDRISYVHAIRVMRRRIVNPGAFPPGDRPASVIDRILEKRVVIQPRPGQAPERQAEDEWIPPPHAWPGVAPETRLDIPNRLEPRLRQQY